MEIGLPGEMEIADAAAMEAAGAALARTLSHSALIFLRGELGAGKTTLVRGFLHQRGHRGAVKSPTYTLIECYELPDGEVCHLDLYRLGDPEELEFLGFRDLLARPVTCLIEWPEMGEGYLPRPDIDLHIEYEGTTRRLIFDEIFDK